MSQLSIHSLFKPPEKRKSAWPSHLTSGTAHVIIFLILAVIAVPAVHEIQPPEPHVTLIAPVLPEYHAKLTAPRLPARIPEVVQQPQPLPVKVLPAIKPPVVAPQQRQPQLLAAAPEVKPAEQPAPMLPEPKFTAPAPKPEVRTGVFQATDQAKGPQAPKAVAIGGFGDPQGVPPSTNSNSSGVMMARVGSFDMPEGAGNAGGGGRSSAGGPRAPSVGSFGDSSANGSAARPRGTVQTGAFGNADSPATQPARARAAQSQPALTPVEILYKPKPVYTQEARNLKIEGEVSLEVVFMSTGSIRVLRVVRGLGHGLDEAAEQAATQVKFRPAMRGGVPVDTNATINITFELT
ncbi:MAG: TonB family protein [Acidobacteriaceae bacterium]|nr:TonB family protein [Acidobacteriaceae bacterium]MBV8569998.1 TonB family protein [Acidobacteriaceae bacterium]